ncbi:hypothetical protein PVK06_012585 [Gossypium arboreum]|uniref:Uncharacterized protein n=1 Tax=Gossypium arboreum TaxID=29729 RepID=A0ABR0QBU3_GOSAR|nr:hypothetical protein PVK06_012585 [Gossypium arboreum]
MFLGRFKAPRPIMNMPMGLMSVEQREDNRPQSVTDLYHCAHKFVEAKEINQASCATSQREDRKNDCFTLKDAIEKEKWNVEFVGDNEELIHDKEGNDPMVVSMVIVGFEVKRILVDNGSAVEVLSWEVFQKMALKEHALSRASPLYDFMNHQSR